MSKIFTSNPTVYEKMGEDLVSILSDGTEQQVEENIKKLLQGKYATGAIKQLNSIRSVIDNIIPTALFVSISDIEKELYKYTKITQPGIIAEDKIIGGARAPAAQEAYQRNDLEDTLKFTKELASAVREGVEEFSKSSIVQKIPYDILIQSLTTSGQLSGLTKTLGRDRCYRLLQPISNSSNLTSFGSGIDYVFVFSDFTTAGKIQDYVSPKVEAVIKSWGSNLLSKKVGLRSLLDLGHAIAKTPSTEDTEQEMLLNFPKLAQVILDKVLDIALNASGTLPPVNVVSVEQETANFIKATYQIENTVEISKDFSEGFLQIFVRLGGQVLKFENSVINQYRGSAFEGASYKSASQVEVAVKLKQYLESVREKLVKDAQNNRVDTVISSITGIARVALINKSSPSLIDFIELSISNIFSGKTTKPFSQKKPVQKVTKPKLVKTSTIKTKASPKTKVTKLKSSKQAMSLPAITSQSTTNLSMLMTQINSNITKQVRQNMGTGDRRDVLNYRTGRFAESVKVERMSESRQGMITVFYSYMKNPYATFSQGGRQELPRSRDPKLLISKSIREIAQSMVTNRMRAVSL